jgi:uncharacterized protein (TIRG00374 family)
MKIRELIFTFLLLVIGIILIGIIMVLSEFDVLKFIELVQTIPIYMFLFWLFLGVLEYLLQVFRFKVISESEKSFIELTLNYNLGHLIAFISPSRAIGEGLRVLVFKKYLNMSDSKAISSIAIERVFDLVVLCVALTGVLFIFSDLLVPLFVFLVVLFMLFFLRSSRIHKFVLMFIPIKSLKELASNYFKETYTFTRDNVKTSKVVVLSLFVWIVDFFRFWSILNFLGVNVSFILVSGVGAFSYFATIISIFPGGLAFFEGAGTGSLTLLGFDASLVLSAIFIERIFSYWMFIVTGVIIYLSKLYFERKENK